MGWHPIDDRPLNLIEQTNQTWTYLVTLKALPFLFERHPDAGGFCLNLGTQAGTDITSPTSPTEGVGRRQAAEIPGMQPQRSALQGMCAHATSRLFRAVSFGGG